MARSLSTAAANYLAAQGSLTEMHEGGVLVYYSGSRPANADAACAGTGCVAFTIASGVLTKEVKGTTVIGLGSVSSNNCTALTIGGVSVISGTVTWVDTAANLAIALAANINAYRTYPRYTAVASGTNVTISAPKNAGAKLNGLTVAITCTAATINGGSSSTFGGTGGTAGVTQVNGLTHTMTPSGGSATKLGTWTGKGGSANINTALGTSGFTGFASGTQTAAWFRYYATPTDPELSGTPTADSGALYIRVDGTIATSGGDITATGGTTITYDATHTENTYTLSIPASQTNL